MTTVSNGMQTRALCISLAVMLLIFATNQSLHATPAVKTYGYFSANYEDTGVLPEKANDPGEFGIPHLNLMFQSSISNDFRTYLNLFADGAQTVEVRNVWGEYSYRDYLKFRFGKLYRPFDLYNEKLDALPTHNCIEPPELFDKDHLMIPRTGDFMVHGTLPVAGNLLKYSITTGNNEVVSSSKPVSWDLNYSPGKFLIGTSGYYANEKEGSPIGIGDGSPTGGILPWMKSDKYMVVGGYAQAKWSNFQLQVAYWTADHKAIRDTGAVRSLSTLTYLNAEQSERFGLNSAMLNDNGDHTISTYYLRLGYTIPEGTLPGVTWEVTPFLFWDYYKNPETIAKKTYGGDNEAGVADDGAFSKPTIGITVRPNPQVALKVDASSHQYKWTDPTNPSAGSKNVHYEEVRVDLSFYFE